eukprot:1336009-Amorphochlora_amoeboformis.AAC.1
MLGIRKLSDPFVSLSCHTLLHVAATSPFATVVTLIIACRGITPPDNVSFSLIQQVDIVNEIEEQDRMIGSREGLHPGIEGRLFLRRHLGSFELARIRGGENSQDWRFMVTSKHIRLHRKESDADNQLPNVKFETRVRESPNILRASLDLTDELERNPLHYVAAHTSDRAT